MWVGANDLASRLRPRFEPPLPDKFRKETGRLGGRLRVLGRGGVDGGGQLLVERGHGVARVVGAEAKLYHVVLVAEPWMVVELFGGGGHLGEEGKGGRKVSEAEAAAQAVVGFGPQGDNAFGWGLLNGRRANERRVAVAQSRGTT